MSQTFLTENPPMILDATCSFKTKNRWPSSATIRIDILKEVRPDIVADARYLPFRDGVFTMIYCDPPHMFRNKPREMPKVSYWFASVNRNNGYATDHAKWGLARFGYWLTQEEWFDFVEHTNFEFHRCLDTKGELQYKITECNGKSMTSPKDLERMTNFQLMKRRITQSPQSNPVHWLTMKPK